MKSKPKRKGPKPFKKSDKRVLAALTLSPKERAAIDAVRGDVTFSVWARGVLMAAVAAATKKARA